MQKRQDVRNEKYRVFGEGGTKRSSPLYPRVKMKKKHFHREMPGDGDVGDAASPSEMCREMRHLIRRCRISL
jgi:hypothetical protein